MRSDRGVPLSQGVLLSSRLIRGAVAGTTVAMGLAFIGQSAVFAAGPDRATVEASPDWTASATAAGHTDAATKLHLSVLLNLRDAAGAAALADAVSDPRSASYRQYVTAAQWRGRFAPTSGQVSSVTRFLTDSGFTVTDVPANGRYVAFDGTAAQAEKAFGTTLQDYERAGKRVSAPSTASSVPAALGGLVAGISGLDTSAAVAPLHITPAQEGATGTPSATPQAPAGQLPGPGPVFRNAPPCSDFYGQKQATGVPQILADPLTLVPCGYKPGQIRGAYGTAGQLGQGRDGRGVRVAIVDAYAAPTILKDAQTYATRNDPDHPLRGYQFRQVLPGSFRAIAQCGPQGWYGEETLDVEAVHATAPAANIVYVGASSCLNVDILAAVNTIVDNGLADVISNSYGNAGEAPEPKVEHQTYLQAAAQGISVLFSSGDSGDEIANTGTRQVDSPASDPYVTAVGGTALAVGKSNDYLFEQGWGTGSAALTNGAWVPTPPAFLYGGGGGISRVWDQPGYQKGVVPDGISQHYQGTKRAVPDVAMVGDPNTGFLIGQSQQFPDGSIKYSEYRIGGTSLSSPLFAGVVAVANQVAGHSLGFLNPALYGLVGTDAFRDVDHGRQVTDGVVRRSYNNGVDASAGVTTYLRTLNQTGSIYTRKGYDDVTGVGSPNGAAFLKAMAHS